MCVAKGKHVSSVMNQYSFIFYFPATLYIPKCKGGTNIQYSVSVSHLMIFRSKICTRNYHKKTQLTRYGY